MPAMITPELLARQSQERKSFQNRKANILDFIQHPEKGASNYIKPTIPQNNLNPTSKPTVPITPVEDNTPIVDNSNWLSNKLGITTPNQSQDVMGMLGVKPKQSFPMSPTDNYQEQVPQTIQNTEVQSPVLKSTDNSNDSHQQFMDNQQQQTNDLIRQGMNNQYGMQGTNSANSAIAYDNNLEAGLAVAANSQRAGSYIPHYQKAVVYTPQAMNFGNSQPQPTNMVFGNQPNNSTLGRIGNINGLNMYDANGQLQSFNKHQITDAGKKMEGKFIGADNQLHDKSVMGGFTANNENYKQLQNLGKRNLFNQIGY